MATRQLDGLGYTKSSVAKAAKVGRLHRIHRGIYVVGHRRLSWHGRCMAAVPAMNLFVAGHEIDAWWEAERFGVELDVYETHGSRLSFEEDRERDDELLHAGIARWRG